MKHRKYIRFFTIFLILSLILPFFLTIVQTSPDEETRSPTGNIGRTWVLGANAYDSDNSFATCVASAGTHLWFNYGFDFGEAEFIQIDEVLVGVEHYVADINEAIKVKVYDGTSWTPWSDPFTYTGPPDVMLWLDYTDKVDWTPGKVNNIRTQVQFLDVGGGACYPNNMYFVCITNASLLDRELLNITEWAFYNPRQIQEILSQNGTLYVLSWNVEGWFINENSKIVQVDEHDEGNYTLYDMYSGVLDIEYIDEDGKNKTKKWESHIELTSNHEVLYSLDNETWILDTSESLYNHWANDETVYVNHLWWNYTLKPFLVTDVQVTKKFKDKVYNVWTEGDIELNYTSIQYKKGKTLSDSEYNFLMHLKKCEVPIGKFPPFLAISTKIPYTVYLDWIPIKVTYSVGAAGVNFLAYGLLGIFILTPCMVIIFVVWRRKK